VEKQPKKSTARELLERGVGGVVGMIPIAGNPIAVAFATAVGWSFNRRMTAWFDELAEALSELQERTDGLSFDKLAENDGFVDAVVAATRAAQATHAEEKLEALRNGVLNTLGPDAPTLDEQARFFRLVEQFTPPHLRFLAFLDDPGPFFDAAGASRPMSTHVARHDLIETALPELANPKDWAILLEDDLIAAGLLDRDRDAPWQSATTRLGKRFLAFIREPQR
jgi:hypothetical protein